MKIDLLDMDKVIDVNNLEQVKSPNLFSSKMVFDSNGILSTEIFGTSKGDRRNTFAWIDLRQKFIHPHLYQKVIKPMQRNILYIVNGRKKWKVINGQLIEAEDGWTGLAELYNHWEEIDWKKRNSSNQVNTNLLVNLQHERDKVFIDKILVCPPAYRDVTIAGTMDTSDHVSEVNTLYTRLIRSVALLAEGGVFARRQYATQMNIQDTLVEIMDFFKSQISRKQGLIRKNLIGKSVDYGVRTVISAPTYNNERFEDSMIDIEHTLLPIYQCCSLFYPFIEAWMKNFFTREVINDPNCISFYDVELKKEITATIKDPEAQFSEKNIKKWINDYCLNPDNRFKVIPVKVTMPTKDGNKELIASMILKGKIILENNATKVLNRAMTITDLLYLACVETCEKRHVMVSRYPVGTDKGIYFNKIRVQSTKTHIHLVFNGVDYKYYPDIDFTTDHDKVGVQFIDTLVMSNSHLDGMGADYDGDQVSARGIYSDEANAEAEEIMKRKMSALNINGTNSKTVSREVFNALYELTKIMDGGRVLSEPEQERMLQLTPSSITRTMLADMFADMVNSEEVNNTKKHKPRYLTWDKMTIPAGYFYKGQSKIDTTVGRFIANKFILEGSGVIGSTGFMDVVMNKSSIGDLDNLIGDIYMTNIIDRSNFNKYIDRRDCLGYWLNGMLAHTISAKFTKPLPEIEKKKRELCKKYEKELASGDIDVMTRVSDELVAYAKEVLKDDPGMDLYLSGDLDFGNNYKNNAIIKGAVINKITGEFDFIDTSFMDGIEAKDLPAHANSILASQFPASIATADAGYLGKRLIALLQMMEVDGMDTDCHTKNLIPIKVTKHNSSNLIYTFIDEGGGQFTMLDKNNVKKYIGKTVKMRSPMSCTSDKICMKCASMLFYYLGVEHAGLFATQISHADLNLALKAKHNSLVNLYTLNPNDIIQDL